MKPVYSPCKESLLYMFGGRNKKLPPGGTVFDNEGEARFVVKRFAHFGVCFMKVKQGTKRTLDEDGIKEADAVYEVGNKKWAEETVADFHESTKVKREAGIPVEEPPAVKTARKILGVAVMLLALVFATASWAQDAGQHKSANFGYKYDVASTTMTYCAVQGQQGDPYATAYDGAGTIETSGSSTTVTGVDAARDVFAPVDPGDVIFIRFSSGTTEVRIVVTNADADTITVDTAIDLSAGYTWSYKKTLCGTGVDDGWVSVAGYSIVQVGFQYDAGDLTIANMTMECKSGALGALPVRVYPGIASDCGDGTLNGKLCEFTTLGDRLYFKMFDNAFAACRVGVSYTTADGATVDEVTTVVDVGR